MNDRPSRSFDSSDQIRFAELSGDWNPIHVDPVAARRTPYGQIVHGVHALAWTLETYLEGAVPGPEKVKVAFLKPITLDEEVRLVRSREGQDHVFLVQRKTKVLASIRITPGSARFADECGPVPGAAPGYPETPSFADLRGLQGSLDAWGDAPRLRREFPNLTGTLGTLRTASLFALSRLVGMVCPGLNSIFSGLEFTFAPADDRRIGYKVSRHSIPNAPVRVLFSGGGVEGNLDAFYRPAPAAQVGMAELHKHVKPDEFLGQTALVIGGSRGLGESLAKIVAAGGGHPIVTYHVGEADARKVAEEIGAGGGRCGILKLDVRDAEGPVAALAASGTRITHVYYFASPTIQNNKGAALDRALLDSFLAYYVEAFDRLCRAVAVTVPKGSKVKVFYPSTVYLAQAAPGFAEYICAKAAGETLCGYLAREIPVLSIAVERLPRMHTDQTNSFLEKKAPEAHEVLLGVVRKMSSENLQEAAQWA